MYFVRKGQMRCQYDEEYYSAARKRRWELREQPRAPQAEIRVWDLHTAGVSHASISRLLGVGIGLVRRVIGENQAVIFEASRGVREDSD